MISNNKMFQTNKNKINAPMFIYSILYNKPSPQISGRTSNHPQKLVNKIPIDENIPTESILKLQKIKQIELTSSCQGSSLLLPTFLIFRTLNQDINYIQTLIKNLNSHKNIKSNYGVGNSKKFRIGITTKLFYSPDNVQEFNKWWNNLSSILQSSLPKD